MKFEFPEINKVSFETENIAENEYQSGDTPKFSFLNNSTAVI